MLLSTNYLIGSKSEFLFFAQSILFGYDKGGDCKIRGTLSGFCFETLVRNLQRRTTVYRRACYSPITQMRAVEALENEDGVIFLPT